MLKPVPSCPFNIFEDGWCVERSDSGSVPFGEGIWILADGVHKVVERLRMHLHIRNEHEEERLELSEDLLFKRMASLRQSERLGKSIAVK